MEITGQFMVLVPVLIGVVEVIKRVGLKTRWAPLCALFLGVVAAWGLSGWSVDMMVLIEGLVAGLSAAGLWSGTRATLQV